MPGEKEFGGYQEHKKLKRNLYDILGVSPTATDQEIKSAFRRRARETHPDIPKNKGKENEFTEINEANQVLSDPEKRKVYDLSLYIGTSKAPSTQDTSQTQHPPRRERPQHQTHERHTSPNFEDLLKNIKREFDDILKDPTAGINTVRDLNQKARKKMDETFGNVASGHKAGKSTGSEGEAEQSRSKAKQEHENPRTDLRVEKRGSNYYLVDEQGRSKSSGYQRIEQKGEYFIGQNITGSYYILNPETGREMSSPYKQIEIKDDFIVGTNITGSKYILNPSTGREMSTSYTNFDKIGDYIIATNSIGSQYLLSIDGKTLSSSYKHIRVADGLIIGQNILGSEYLLDGKTGRELTSSYKKIEKRGGKIIGHKLFGEEEIKLNK